MILLRFDRRTATIVRLVALVLIGWTVVGSHPGPSTSGRGLVVFCLLVAEVAAFLWWTARPLSDRGVTPDLYVMAIAGGVLIAASPNSAASAFVFVALVAAAVRVEIPRALPLLALSLLALAVSVLVYDNGALGLLAYALGFAAALLAASNARQSVARAEQAELLLAQTQRSQEEQLRAARLEESTRIAREIHDVLAHALAGLAIQLEATQSLLERGAERDVILERVQRAHALAREGLVETRRAVGALRGEAVPVPDAIRTLVDEYDGHASLAIDGDLGRLNGPAGLALVRAVQEGMTNVCKHAPGADVAVTVDAGETELVAVVADRVNGASPAPLAQTGGGYGLQGMRERAQSLGGTMSAGATPDGWRVELRLPVQAGGV
jgi:signal transduction histidine kinase